MYISLFLEINDAKEALYRKEFEKKKNNTDDVCLVSPEYSDKEEEKVTVIPKDILQEIDNTIQNPAFRDVVLKIERFEALEQWFEQQLQSGQKIDGVMAYGLYYSLLLVCKKYDVPIYIVGNEAQEYSHDWGEVRLRNQYVELSEELKLMTEQKTLIEQERNLLKEYKESTDKHVNELQAKISLLTTQMQQYRESNDHFNDERKALEEEMQRLRENNQLYIQMYKDELEKVNESKTRILQLEQRKK